MILLSSMIDHIGTHSLWGRKIKCDLEIKNPIKDFILTNPSMKGLRSYQDLQGRYLMTFYGQNNPFSRENIYEER
jgi:hypothetical protein